MPDKPTDLDPPNDYPWAELAESAKEVIEAGGLVFFKFTCDHCGERVTFEKPNTIYGDGECFACGKVTLLGDAKGGNYMVVTAMPRTTTKGTPK